VDNLQCSKLTPRGEVSSQSCRVTLRDNTVTINSGAVNDVIRWRARSTDAAGNTGEAICEVRVTNPGKN